MPYTQVGREHYWVGDSASPLYNRFASSEDGTFDRQQSERLIDYEKPYQYCLNISYNEEGTPGKGSAIFLHCYSDNSYTEGCIAIPEDAMKRILRRRPVVSRKKRIFPLNLGRAALCRRLAFHLFQR